MNQATSASDSTKSNEGAFRRFVDEVFSAGDVARIDELIAADFTDHQSSIRPANRDGVKAAITFLHRLAPDFSLKIDECCTCGDLVWARGTGRGTHTGPGLGEPTGRSWEITVMDVCRYRDGVMVEHWGVPDRFAQMEQLGLLPHR
ncbi:MAG: ester cyclase [Candidatus Dormibacteria bacterium]